MKFRIGEKNKRVRTEPQVRVFLEKANEMDWEWYPHWFLAIYTGMRSGELYALTWAKVNLEDRLIRVDTSWNSNDGFKSTKSGDERVLEIAPKLLTFLNELKLKNSDSHFVLPRINDWDKGLQARPLGLSLQSIGLPRVRFHDLRATWATTNKKTRPKRAWPFLLVETVPKSGPEKRKAFFRERRARCAAQR